MEWKRQWKLNWLPKGIKRTGRCFDFFNLVCLESSWLEMKVANVLCIVWFLKRCEYDAVDGVESLFVSTQMQIIDETSADKEQDGQTEQGGDGQRDRHNQHGPTRPACNHPIYYPCFACLPVPSRCRSALVSRRFTRNRRVSTSSISPEHAL